MRLFSVPNLLLTAALLGGCSIEQFLPDRPDATAPVDAWDDAPSEDDVVDAEDEAGEDTSRPDAARDVAADPDGDDVFFEPDVPPSFDLPEPTAPPVLDYVFPTSGSALGGQVVVVQGANFSLDMEVRIGGVLQPRLEIIDEYEVAFFTEPGTPGTWEIKVTTGAGVASWPGGFTYVEPLGLASVEPGVARAGGVTEVRVVGSGFSEATRFVAGDREALVSRRRSAQEVDLLVAPAAAGAWVDLWAFDGESRAVLRDALRFEASPQLRALLPSVGGSAGGEWVRVDGEGIDAGCTVAIAGTHRPVVVDSSGWPSFQSPGGPPGVVDVSIDCGARGGLWAEGAFELVEEGGLLVRRIWPTQTFTRGGEVVTVSGRGLAEVTRVRFDGQLSTVLSRSEHGVEVLAPPHEAGVVDLTVEVPTEARVFPAAFRYVSQPAFTSVSPPSGDIAGFAAALTGEGLEAIDAVIIDGVEVELAGRNEGRVVFQVPAGPAGRSDLRVRIGAIVLDTGLDVERVGALRWDGFQPREGAMSGGTAIYVTGSGFTSSCRVLLDGVEAATEVRGGSVLAALTPPHEPGSVLVSVSGCGAPHTFPTPYRYVDPTRLPGGVGGGSLDGELRVSVREFQSNAPVVGATVQVDVRTGTPYAGLTDAAGQITFVGEDLVGPQVITAYGANRSAETYYNTGARDVTLMLNPLPPPPCDPADPACAPPPPPPVGEIIGFLTGLRKVVDPPPGTVLAARIETTRQSQGYVNPDPGPDGTRYEEGPFRITARLGDMALVALCGYEYVSAVEGHALGEFVPITMGVVRGISLREAEPARVAVDCGIPLSESVTIKIPGAPLIPESIDDFTWPGSFRARLHFDFGGEGWFESLPIARSDAAIFAATGFPPLVGDLAGVRYDVTAGVYPRTGNIPAAESWVRRVPDYATVLVMPELLPMPVFTIPTVENPRLADGYVEWSMPAGAPVPSFYSISLSSSNSAFPRWTIYLPGSETSFHLTDFSGYSEVYGDLPTPGDPAGTFSIYLRAISMEVFSFDDFDRYALRSRGWRSVSTTYRNLTLGTGPAPESVAE